LTVPKAFGYARVSTTQQAVSGLGLEAQEQHIKRYFDYALAPKGYLWGGLWVDPGISGGTPLLKRPSAQRMADGLEDGDAVIFAKLDRGFRDMVDLLLTLADWDVRKISSHFLDISVDSSTDIGKLVITIMGAVARWERSRISERLKDAFRVLREKGIWLGGAPYGWKRVKGQKHKLVPNEPARVVGRYLVSLHLKGWRAAQILQEAEDQGYRHWTGKRLTIESVPRIIRQELALLAREARGWTPAHGVPGRGEGDRGGWSSGKKGE
jgi:DNA invertase Pin-like site-specific DNA recombinase